MLEEPQKNEPVQPWTHEGIKIPKNKRGNYLMPLRNEEYAVEEGKIVGVRNKATGEIVVTTENWELSND